MDANPVWIGVDAGGTKILAGVVNDAGAVVRTATTRTPGTTESPESVVEAVATVVGEVAQGAQIAGVGFGAAGFVDAAGAVVRFAPHLPWRDYPAQQALTARLGVPVALDNDANCAALGEAAFGAARGARLALVVALGTGIGGALICQGQVFRGAQGMAGEFGHQVVVPQGLSCECGRRGCWEQYCSGRALERAVDEPMSGPEITEAARNGDRAALDAFEQIGFWLGRGIANLVAALDPGLVVIGGGVSAAGEILLAPARRELAAALVGGSYRDPVSLIAAELGAHAGIVGAAQLVKGRNLDS